MRYVQLSPFCLCVRLHTPSQGCTNYKSSARWIEGELADLINRKEQGWRLTHASTPLVWNYITYASLTYRGERVSGSRVYPFVHTLDSSHIGFHYNVWNVEYARRQLLVIDHISSVKYTRLLFCRIARLVSFVSGLFELLRSVSKGSFVYYSLTKSASVQEKSSHTK